VIGHLLTSLAFHLGLPIRSDPRAIIRRQVRLG
jgi:hypothetical protein